MDSSSNKNREKKLFDGIKAWLSKKISELDGSVLACNDKKYIFIITVILFAVLLIAEYISDNTLLNLRYLFSALIQGEASLVAIVLIVAIFKLENISHHISIDSNVFWDSLKENNKILKDVIHSNIPLSRIVLNVKTIDELLAKVKEQEPDKYDIIDRHIQSVKFYVKFLASFKKTLIKLVLRFIVYIILCVIALLFVPAYPLSFICKIPLYLFMSLVAACFVMMLFEIFIFTKKSLLVDPALVINNDGKVTDRL